MQIARILCAALAGALLAGCANTAASPLKPNVDFVRGCWLERNPRDGRIDAFLRLLPDGPDGANYVGELEYTRGIKPGPKFRITIARDGTRASGVIRDVVIEFKPDLSASPAVYGSQYAAFSAHVDGRAGSLVVVGGKDRLSLKMTDGVTDVGINGAHDSCD
jgi:hypothetical protein